MEESMERFRRAEPADNVYPGGTNGSVSDGLGSHHAASGGGGVGDFANGNDVARPGVGSHHGLCSC